MNPSGVIRINAVVYQENDRWIAHCLEYDFVSCAEKLEDLPNELLYQIIEQVEGDLEAGQEPFFGFKPAPKKYWDMWEAVKAVSAPIKPHKGVLLRLRELVERSKIEARLFPVGAAPAF